MFHKYYGKLTIEGEEGKTFLFYTLDKFMQQ